VPFLIFLKSFEVLLYEVMSWVVFYPRTLWRSARHPLRLMARTDGELKLAPAEQFRDVVSPPIFLLLTVVIANAFQVAIVGNNPLIDSGIGLAGLISDNTSLILFRLVAFAMLPAIAGAFALTVARRPVDRDSLQPFFYAQCFATTPVVLLCSIAETVTRLTERSDDIAGAALFAVAGLFYVAVEARWFSSETGRSRAFGIVWALAAFAISLFVLGGTALLFAGL